MADQQETKDFAQEGSPVEETTVETTEDTSPAPAAVTTPAEEEKTAGAAPEENSRRLVVAGLASATLLSLIAVLVGGIFQSTARWLNHRTRDLPVNERLLVLWKEMVSAGSVAPQPLGVQGAVAETTKFKTVSSPTPESGKGEK